MSYFFRDDERESAPSASYVRELRQDMVIMKGQLNELKQMMRVSFDLQLDIQRAVHQEVAAALACLSQPNATIDGGSVPTSRSALGACPIPTLGMLKLDTVCMQDGAVCMQDIFFYCRG